MTEKQIVKFLKYLNRKKQLTRKQINRHFSKSGNSNRYIQHLLLRSYIQLVSAPIYSAGEFVEQESDTFVLTTDATNLLDEQKEHFFLQRLPVILSILAIMKSYGVGPDDIIIWCMRQLGL